MINSLAGAASVAAAFGQIGVAVSIGGAVAINEISTSVDAYINNMGDGLSADQSEAINALGDTRVIGDITVNAEQNAEIDASARRPPSRLVLVRVGVAVSGAGASATNYILTSTNASIENSAILNADAIDIDA